MIEDASHNAEDRLFRALRRLLHASDSFSRQLAAQHQVTAPQLVCLQELLRHGPMIPSVLARNVALSQPTVTGILQRLEARGLVTRIRDQGDRRRVTLRLTPAGTEAAQRAPSPLHVRLAVGLHALEEGRRVALADALDELVAMLEREPGADALQEDTADAARALAAAFAGSEQADDAEEPGLGID
ncbi:MAG: MarR family transcriptional regulator [Deltaproteobacteria bacterium]|nr:MarR family transcriptional regulator [Deltaproteobacteria bacterium]